jgi:hypothetical protein
MKKLTVESHDLFKGYKIGGLVHGQYLSLTAHKKLSAQLNFIENIVIKISQVKYDQNLGWPANLWHLALQIDNCIKQIDIHADPAISCMLTLEIGKLIEKINKLPLTKQAILNFEQIMETRQTRVNGADIANEKIAANKDNRKALVIKKWRMLAEEEIPKENRVSIIVNYLKDENGNPIKITQNTVRTYLKEANLLP